MLLRSMRAAVAAAVGPGGHGEPQERHRADLPADLTFERVFRLRPFGMPVTAGPGFQESVWQAVPPDERGADVPAEDRGAVIAAAGIPAADPPAVLAQPTPQAGLVRGSERMGADAVAGHEVSPILVAIVGSSVVSHRSQRRRRTSRTRLDGLDAYDP